MHDEERVSIMIGPGSVNTAHPAAVLPRRTVTIVFGGHLMSHYFSPVANIAEM